MADVASQLKIISQVLIRARYGTEELSELIDTGFYNGNTFSPYITFAGYY